MEPTRAPRVEDFDEASTFERTFFLIALAAIGLLGNEPTSSDCRPGEQVLYLRDVAVSDVTRSDTTVVSGGLASYCGVIDRDTRMVTLYSREGSRETTHALHAQMSSVSRTPITTESGDGSAPPVCTDLSLPVTPEISPANPDNPNPEVAT